MDDFLDRMSIWREAYRHKTVSLRDYGSLLTVQQQADHLVDRGYFEADFPDGNDLYHITPLGIKAYEAISNMYSVVFQGVMNR